MTGRLRVRCLGVHTGDKLALPTADLPWASVTLPTTASGISGLGQSPSFIVEGSWVWGYFRDGSGLMQEMVIVGTLPGMPKELGNTKKGFYDPNTCLLYTSPSPRDLRLSRMPSSSIVNESSYSFIWPLSLSNT